jgi:hypothetical protein
LRFLFPDRLAHGVDAGGHQFLCVERRAPDQEFVEQHPEAVDVAARINVQPAHLRLLRAHVRWRANELLKLGMDRFVGQLSLGGFGDAEVDHLGHRHTIVQCDEDVRRLDVAMDNALLMGVLDGLAHLDKEIEPLAGGDMRLIAVVRDPNAAHQFHYEVGAARLGGAGIEHLGDVRVIHHRQCLALRFKACDHRFGVHAQLDNLQGDFAPDWLFLLGQPNCSEPAFAQVLKQLVAAKDLPFRFVQAHAWHSSLSLGGLVRVIHLRHRRCPFDSLDRARPASSGKGWMFQAVNGTTVRRYRNKARDARQG